MKRNLYYKHYYQRVESAGETVVFICLKLASYPRLLLEVFIRKNFGERYFSFRKCLWMALFLAILPFFHYQFLSFYLWIQGMFGMGNRMSAIQGLSAKYETVTRDLLLIAYSTWYIFLVAFIFVAVKRRNEIKRNPSVFDFKKFSLYAGDINPRFFGIKLSGTTPDIRTVESFIEPLFFLVIGLIFYILGQWVGLLLIVSSILYGISYMGAYRLGDHFVMDKIDQLIASEEMMTAFTEDKNPDETRGFRFYGDKPESEPLRTRVAEAFFSEEETFVAS